MSNGELTHEICLLFANTDVLLHDTKVERTPGTPGFTINHIVSVRPEAVKWARREFGYDLALDSKFNSLTEKTIESIEFIIRFESERDAVLFKTFWC